MTAAETITITRADVGRFALGPDRLLGRPIVVQILRRRPSLRGRPGRLEGRCGWGHPYTGRIMTLDSPWTPAQWIEEGDFGWLDGAETTCGGVRGGDWVVLDGDEARVAMAETVAPVEAVQP